MKIFNIIIYHSPNGDVRHYQIKITDTGQFYLAEKHIFSSIPDVIHYHEHNAAGRWRTRSNTTATSLTSSLIMFGFVGLVTRLRYAVGPMGRCVPTTAGFSSGTHTYVF